MHGMKLNSTQTRLALIYLVILSAALFLVDRTGILAGLLCVHLAAYAITGASWPLLWRVLRRLGFFFLFILLAYAINWSSLFSADWGRVPDAAGVVQATTMALRVANVVIASVLIRALADPAGFSHAIRSFGLPASAALAVDGVFELLGASRGGGGGGGKGRGRAGDGGVGISWSDIRARRLEAVSDILATGLRRARTWLSARAPDLDAPQLRDTVLILGAALAVMSLRLLQILPGVPFAPGHKNIVIIPVYLMIAVLSRSRFGATQCGLAIGVLSFFLGQGRFGVFEMLQWVLPGLAADIMAPVLRRDWRLWKWPLFAFAGLTLGVLRFSANFAMILLAGGHVGLFAIYSPFLVSQTVFACIGAVLAPWILQCWPAIEQASWNGPESSTEFRESRKDD